MAMWVQAASSVQRYVGTGVILGRMNRQLLKRFAPSWLLSTYRAGLKRRWEARTLAAMEPARAAVISCVAIDVL